MIAPIIIFLLLVIAVYAFMQQDKFGKISKGEQLQQIIKSPNYKNGKFSNISFTPDLTEGVSYFKVLKEFFLERSAHIKPKDTLPSVKTNLHDLSPDKNVFVWFGHSSYFIQTNGKTILVDPVFSGHASPMSFSVKSFEGANIYSADDMPTIDFLFLSHDHWDHLDYETSIKLKPKIKKIITGLGTAAHLQHWGFDKNIIAEKDWNEEVDLGDGFKVNTTTARHFSGRGFKRNQALWLAFVLQTPTTKFYLGGDSGYNTHFKTIGEKFGPFDYAILECGQYHHNWKYIHMMPEEVVAAAQDLRAAKLIPVHWAKFALGQHAWNDPILRVVGEAKKKNQTIIHPMIGEEVNLTANTKQEFKEWWLGVE